MKIVGGEVKKVMSKDEGLKRRKGGESEKSRPEKRGPEQAKIFVFIIQYNPP